MKRILVIPSLLFAFFLIHCDEQEVPSPGSVLAWEQESYVQRRQGQGFYSDSIARDVRIADYFRVMDSVAVAADSLVGYPVNIHLLMRANSWILQRLVNTDYDLMAARDSFVYDQRQEIVLRRGERLFIPGEEWGKQLTERISESWIDINIPEYALRLMEGEREVMKLTVRVGQNREGYFAEGNRMADLRTRTGRGIISGINYDPIFSNPRTGVRYKSTRRDDGRRTLLPRIPSLEPEINGICTGQLIHCTTNPETLGKAYSNGCIGVGEADMWRVYFWAPEGTAIQIRYDLHVTSEHGDHILLPDIYGWSVQD